MISVISLMSDSTVLKKFKSIIHDKLNVGQLPIYDIKSGDNALSYDPIRRQWLYAPVCSGMIIGGNNKAEDVIKRDRRCYTNGCFSIDDINEFEKIFEKIDCNDKQLLLITWGDNYDTFGMIIKEIYENNIKYEFISLEQKYKIAVNALIDIIKSGLFYNSKKKAIVTIKQLKKIT